MKAVMLPWKPELIIYCKANTTKRHLLSLGIKDLWIYLKPLIDFQEMWQEDDAIQGDQVSKYVALLLAEWCYKLVSKGEH
jgi:hypothetical protein